MPKTGTRETFLVIGTAIGVAVSAPAIADTRDLRDHTIILAQANQEQEQEEEQRRRGRGERRQQEQQQEQRQPRQERRERAQEERPQREERRERAQQKQEEQQRERPQREERRERAQQKQEEQKRERPQREERRERAQQKQEEQKRERPQREELRERAQQKQEEQKRERPGREERRERAQQKQEEQKQERPSREERRERVEQRQERKQEQREDRREEKRERVEERAIDREISREEREDRRRDRREFSRERLGDIKRERRERRLEGGRVVIEEPGSGDRRIIRDRGRIIIEHDETERLRGGERDVRVEKGPRGRTRTVITRPNGVEIISIEDRDGRLIRRIKRMPNGREFVLINNEFEGERRYRDRRGGGVGFYVDLPDFVLSIPEREYYVYADDADEEEIYDVLSAPPAGDLEDDYTLDEIRYSPDIRKRLRKLNFNSINFESGSWDIPEDQIDKLAVVAKVINRILRKNPDEIFLIGGYTDAVGTDEDNLSLSDRRAESVARVLTDEFNVPPENLVTQGYGESDLLIDTEGPEIRNRRVEFMRITPFLAQKQE